MYSLLSVMRTVADGKVTPGSSGLLGVTVRANISSPSTSRSLSAVTVTLKLDWLGLNVRVSDTLV